MSKYDCISSFWFMPDISGLSNAFLRGIHAIAAMPWYMGYTFHGKYYFNLHDICSNNERFVKQQRSAVLSCFTDQLLSFSNILLFLFVVDKVYLFCTKQSFILRLLVIHELMTKKMLKVERCILVLLTGKPHNVLLFFLAALASMLHHYFIALGAINRKWRIPEK